MGLRARLCSVRMSIDTPPDATITPACFSGKSKC
uniref:Uncharacterized protein n=1 Tax=Podoviridae sp. ctCWF2 TaxID=2825230 RepID=A0A8S5PIJ2_9CAUD|nr:MAG TPA: hypothetical protein [Podoviridae sp. ctCWF2]